MISFQELIKIQAYSIEHYGGGEGLRLKESLEAAIARPFQTFDGAGLYPDAITKAAAVAESIIVNHPFTDGNKRTGFLVMVALLEHLGCTFTATQEEAYDFIIDVSTGTKRFDEMVDWLTEHTIH